MVSVLAKLRFERLRRRALKASVPDYLRRYLTAAIPPDTVPATKASILAVDFETNGLNAKADHILSIGAIAVDGGTIPLATGWHTLVASRNELDHAVVPVHRITHDMLDDGTRIETALEALFNRLEGRFLLAHHAAVETGFLAHTLKKLYGVRVPFFAIDTLLIERHILARRHRHDGLRLTDARQRYGLPAYQSHHALTDALAAAELFLAQVRHHHPKTKISSLLTPFL